MADYPCDLHVARYKGPSTRLFLNCYRDDQVLQLRVSVCEACLDLLLEPWAHRAYHKVTEGHWDPWEGEEDVDGLWIAQERPASQRNGLRR